MIANGGNGMQLVIFDLDGIIVSTDQYHYEAWKALSDAYGLKFDYNMNQKLRGISRAESLQIILQANNKEPNAKTFEKMLYEKNEIYKNKLFNLPPSSILIGAIDLINDLKKHNVYVAVGSSSKNTSFILKRIGLEDTFDVVVDGNQISNSKPDPEVFQKCAVALGIDSKECIVLEDAKAGIQAALNSGMIAIGVGKSDLRGAHLIIPDLTKLSYYSLLQTYNLNCRSLVISR